MKKVLSFFILILLPMVAGAYQAEINGIYYNFNKTTKTAKVTYYSSNNDYQANRLAYNNAVNIPASVNYNGDTYDVTEIGYNAFRNCISLNSVTIPNSVTNIGMSAFYGCSSLFSITIPNSVTSISDYAFYDTGWYNNQPNGNLYLDNWLIGYKGEEPTGKLIISEGTKGIANYAFNGCSSLTSVTIPNSVTSIGTYAFYGCSGLTSVTIPDSVTSIGDATFENCSGLTSVTIGNSVTSLRCRTFYNCSGLISVTIPNSVTNIWEYAFYGCKALTSVTIPNSVINIGGYAFYLCTGLTSVTIPNSVTNIGMSAFYLCSKLNSVHISDLNAWCRISFNNIDSNPLSWAHHLYLGGEEIKDLVIPNSVKSIEDYTFYGCSGLTSVAIPNSVTSIGESAFQSCNSIKTLTISDELNIIKKSTFQYCSSLKEIVIPAKVEYIYADAFSGCKNIECVKSLATTPPWAHENAFSNYDVPLYVPTESVNSYQTTSPWSKFGSLKTLSGEDANQKCKTPTIAYNNGKLTFDCETEGVEYRSSIKNSDANDYTTSSIQLSATYDISVVATKSGYQNSDVATATLCWLDKEPQMEGITETTPHEPNGECAIPVINVSGNKVTFSCSTPGAEFTSTLTTDEEQFKGNELVIGKNPVVYTLTVYATAPGYDRSKPAKMKFTVKKGDLNADGTVDVADIATIIDEMAGK